MSIKFEPIYFDSMGAKSMATFVETPDVRILIDPGAAEMQPSFPAPDKLKKRWKSEALEKIKSYMKIADIVIISHYHHDHYLWREEDMEFYIGKRLFIKDPNRFINLSQRERAKKFLSSLSEVAGIKVKIGESCPTEYSDPCKKLLHATSMDFGDYNERRRKVLEKGYDWFKKLSWEWQKFPCIHEFKSKDIEVRFADGRIFKFGDTTIKFTEPFFHGVEFSRTGWVFSIVIQYSGDKLIHTSDLNGPVIEDYADWIISEKPKFLIVDGPMTYMLGYLVSNITLKRAVDNMVRILKETRPRVVIYDHHLLREPAFRKRTKPVWDEAKRIGVNILTAAEFMGKTPVVEQNLG